MWSSETAKSRLIIIALVMIAALHAPGWLSEANAPGRAARVAEYRIQRDAHDPSYIRFLRQVREKTEPGTTIALVVPRTPDLVRQWYIYRAEWELAGRIVTPVVDPRYGRPVPAAERAELLLAWREDPRLERRPEIILDDPAGILARR